jgi:hypothetical protein
MNSEAASHATVAKVRIVVRPTRSRRASTDDVVADHVSPVHQRAPHPSGESYQPALITR